ncbi:hypothetical protein BWD09_07130 [Neisseria dentiae]|uniref:Cro/Cl family transcriptional regulator n=1 Tax=Neisseria dentiae TaxID=194197 RepID=A0A1X3D9E5_9NEIS|nr:YdaS family helix-turn-helix protein [Neisseria dentiae]OSI16528.1 hypothetical protein BWD09_07130 [Neisseria dentiae]QMT44252.1 helix-turn-helix domain-containing protein [Neisseria dentiae]STZ49887.1 Uncharacterized protein conserved in bacteria, prophage-related [Neisseria dentiae]STZ49931.1 Uncharacterized protein conserved in bacteria, prophage-related [Neisseria dentiae]
MKFIDYAKTQQRGWQTKMANDIGVKNADLFYWVKGKRPVPIHHCVKIERATNGEVTRKDLRPDDWHEIWPELADK